MTDEERQLLDARVEVALAVRRQRKAQKLSQQQLAGRIKSSQPRVVKIERAASDVSLDQLLRAFAAAGGRIMVKKRGRNTTKTRLKPRQLLTRSANNVIELHFGEPCFHSAE